MSDSGQEGFKQQIQEIDTVKIKPLANKFVQVCKYSPQLLLKNPVSLFYQVPLHLYPRNMDSAGIVRQISTKVPQRIDLLEKILKEDNDPVDLSTFFTRKYFCIYNRFKQGFANKSDITILIRNPARHIRNDLFATYQEKVQRKRCRLAFSSEFEGGNLHYVFSQKSEEIYYLLLQNDVNTHGYNYWFHFRLKANEKGNYNFAIVNLTKEVLFEDCQSLLIFNSSTGNFIKNVRYMCRETRFNRSNSTRNYWCLYFELEAKQKDQLYVSLIRPYSYTKLMNFIHNLTQTPFSHIKLTLHIPAKSEMGNLLPSIEISSSKNHSKKYVLITARQHPSQTVGSFVCEAIIKKLISLDQNSLKLLQKFTFFIVPMLNPDGVIHGNSRTNILGFDLNRCWTRYGIMQSRECQSIWKFVEQFIDKNGKIQWCMDLHGHSRELGFFTYFGQRNQRSLLFNQIMSKKCPYYGKEKAVFQVDYTKKQSIRGQFSQRLKVQNTLTIQTSMFGFRNAENKFISFQESHFSEIGINILLSLAQTEEKVKQTRSFSLKSSIRRFRQNQNKHLQALDSDSNPEQDYLLIEERKQLYYTQSENQAKAAIRAQSCQRKRLTTEEIKTTINFKFNNSQNQRNKLSLNKFQELTAKNKGKNKLRTQSNKSISLHNFSNNRIKNTTSEEKIGLESSSNFNEDQNSISMKIKYKEKQQTGLAESLMMRKKIRIAFQSRTKRQTFKEDNKSEVRSILYPVGGSRPTETRQFLREKRGRMKEIRVHQYGVTVVRNFHNSLFMRSHRHNL